MRTHEISVFVDESGSYEPDRQSSRYYLVCMVFHDQDIDISAELDKLEDSLEAMGLDRCHCVHAGPLIRRESEYAGMSREERRGIFRRLFLFMLKTDISYKCFVIDKNFIGMTQDVHDSLLQQIVGFLLSKSDKFAAFDKLKVYHDNGQSNLTTLLKEAFTLFASRTEFVPNVEPARYRLFQVADIACTLELARSKLLSQDGLSMSELAFFGGAKNFKKNYLKPLDRRLVN
ncbi:MAG: DUF3800 domain-containing protein [Kiritimatiellae bacterium]|nr:DUF3800 domain-containing protein [Kiritimatiellia bacterium]